MMVSRRALLLFILFAAVLFLTLLSVALPMATLVQEDRAGFIRARMGLANNQCPTINQKLLFLTELLDAKREPQNMAFDADGMDGVTVTDAILLSTTLLGMSHDDCADATGTVFSFDPEQSVPLPQQKGVQLIAEGNRIYATWIETRRETINTQTLSLSRIRVALRDASVSPPTWRFVDTRESAGLFAREEDYFLGPHPFLWNDRLHVLWMEGAFNGDNTIHVAAYNGDDAHPDWQRLPAIADETYAYNATPFIIGNILYVLHTTYEPGGYRLHLRQWTTDTWMDIPMDAINDVFHAVSTGEMLEMSMALSQDTLFLSFPHLLRNYLFAFDPSTGTPWSQLSDEPIGLCQNNKLATLGGQLRTFCHRRLPDAPPDAPHYLWFRTYQSESIPPWDEITATNLSSVHQYRFREMDGRIYLLWLRREDEMDLEFPVRVHVSVTGADADLSHWSPVDGGGLDTFRQRYNDLSFVRTDASPVVGWNATMLEGIRAERDNE